MEGRYRLTNRYPRPDNGAICEEAGDIMRQMPSFYQELYNALAEGYESK